MTIRHYDADFALNIAELWHAGKMVGGDRDEVIFALMDEVNRLRTLAVSLNDLLYFYYFRL